MRKFVEISGIFVGGISFLIGIVLSVYYVMALNASGFGLAYTRIDPNVTGQIASFFSGIIATLWALAGVSLIFVTYYLQKHNSVVASFEGTFFQLLNQLHDLVYNSRYSYWIWKGHILDAHEVKEEHRGPSFFNYAVESYREVYEAVLGLHQDGASSTLAQEYSMSEAELAALRKALTDDPVVLIKESYSIFFAKYGDYLGHYFRFLYHILRYIDDFAKKSGRDVSDYVSFLQAHLSWSELFLLYYNMQSFRKAKSLMEKYDFLENLPREMLIEEGHSVFYSHSLKTIKALDQPYGPQTGA